MEFEEFYRLTVEGKDEDIQESGVYVDAIRRLYVQLNSDMLAEEDVRKYSKAFHIAWRSAVRSIVLEQNEWLE